MVNLPSPLTGTPGDLSFGKAVDLREAKGFGAAR